LIHARPTAHAEPVHSPTYGGPRTGRTRAEILGQVAGEGRTTTEPAPSTGRRPRSGPHCWKDGTGPGR